MRKGLFFISFIMLCDLAIAQRDDLIKKYQDFRQQARKQHDDFRQRSNQVYADFMRKAWERFQALPKIPRPKDEELTPPVVYPGRDSGEIKDRSLPYEQETPIVQPQPKPILPIREQSSPVEERFSFLFFGTPCEVRAGEQHRFKLKTCESNELATTWSQLSGEAYDHLIKDCLDMRERLQLCDWAYLLFLEQLANSFLGKGTNEATLFMAFLYCQSGYRMRLAESSGKLFLLFASEHIIYDQNYWKIENEYYYALHCPEKSLNICSATFPQTHSLSLLIPRPPLLAETETPKRNLQDNNPQGINVSVSLNKNVLDFFDTYPSSMLHGDFMTRWAYYANTPLGEKTKTQLYPTLQQLLAEKSQWEAANLLISFVQHAFEYEYDNKVWGRDRAFFAEETLYYPYSDCEDRTILFTRLVRDLLGLKVALVYYPGHLAAAVHFTEEIPGDYLLVKGSKYLICDPTYIGAPIGVSMPNMDQAKAKLILLN